MRAKLSRILTVGDTIELKIDSLASNEIIIKSNLYSVIDGQKMVVSSTLAQNPGIKKNHVVKLTSAKDAAGIISMHATVQEVVAHGSDLTIVLDLHTDMERTQRRESFRLPLLKDVEVGLIGERPSMGMTQNISAGGMRCLLPASIREGATLKIKLELDQDTYTFKGKVLQQFDSEDLSGHSIIRIQFVDLTPQEQRKLTSFILTEQGKREAKVKR